MEIQGQKRVIEMEGRWKKGSKEEDERSREREADSRI